MKTAIRVPKPCRGTVKAAIAASMIAATMFATSSCGNKGLEQKQAEINALIAQRDSIARASARTQNEYLNLSDFVNYISTSLDSIARQEHMIFDESNRERPLTRKEVRERMDLYLQLLKRQRERIALLTDSVAGLRARGVDMGQSVELDKLSSMVEFLTQQIEAKDLEIQKMKRELATKNRSISELRENLSTVQQNVTELTERSENLAQALSARDEAENEAFVRFATKKELENEGLISKGSLFKKGGKVDYSKFKSAGFRAVDIRTFTELTIRAKKIKLVTPAPEGSYVTTKNSDGTWTLQITNPTEFWSVSNYLLIQTD